MKEAGIAQVEVVRGDLFDSNADILVVPCSTSGGVTTAVQRRLQKLGVTLATSRGSSRARSLPRRQGARSSNALSSSRPW